MLLLTLLIDRAALVGGVRVVGRVAHLSVALVDHAAAGRTVLAWHLAVGSLVTDRWQLTNSSSVGRRLSSLRWVGRSRRLDLVGLGSLGGSTLALLGSLALSLFLLLPGLPLLADLLEF